MNTKDKDARGANPSYKTPPKRGERCHRCHRRENEYRCALCNPHGPLMNGHKVELVIDRAALERMIQYSLLAGQ